MSSHRDMAQLKIIIKGLELEKEKTAVHIQQLNGSILYKKQTLSKFKNYLQEYEEKQATQAIQSKLLQNNQLFIERLLNLMQDAKSELKRLEVSKTELVKKFNRCANKIEGLSQLLLENVREKIRTMDKINDAENHELSIIRARKK